MKGKKINDWLFAWLLALPLLFFFLGYLLNHSADLIPTGFIQFDNVGYIAYARQYLDADGFSLQYSNPFDIDAGPIYFQSQTLFFALLLKAGVSPGAILIPFTIVCSVICFRLLITIYDHLVSPPRFRTLGIWLFAWGGGLLAIAGIGANAYFSGGRDLFYDVFMLDPEHGWWGLNFGRSLLFSCEAYYHALFLGCVYFLLKRNWAGALLVLFILSLSHPFTGIELTAIVCAWCIAEFFFFRKEIPLWFIIGSFCVMVFHIYYYLIYLNGFADHRSVSNQYSLNWRLRFYRMVPAYCIVGAFAVVSIWQTGIRSFFQLRFNRLFACWFIVAFLLANHEVFMAPKQPVHFTRGYIWTSLFLLGLPAMLHWTGFLKKKWKWAGLIIFATVLFLDNFIWISEQISSKATVPFASHITPEQEDVLKILDAESSNRTLIVSNDRTLAVLSSVYTRAYPWYSHPYTTPFADKKKAVQERLFLKGELDTVWRSRQVNFVLRKTDTVALKALGVIPKQKIIKTRNYIIYKYDPAMRY